MQSDDRNIGVIIAEGVKNPLLLGVLVLAVVGLVFYSVYLKFHRPTRRADLETRKAIEEAKATQTINIAATAVTQERIVHEAATVLSLSKEHLKGLSEFKGCRADE